MKAIAVYPSLSNSVRVVDLEPPKPKSNEVLLRTKRIGVCGTDREINYGYYGEAPVGSEFLIIGHEAVAIIEELGDEVRGFSKGDVVVPTVRRTCQEMCTSCRVGETDRCTSGKYFSHGIHRLHGFGSTYSISDANFLVKVPEELAELAVLLEPQSVVEKAVKESFAIQGRSSASTIKSALVIGAGPIGLLASALLILMNIPTTTIARRDTTSIKAVMAKELGAQYVNVKEKPIGELGRFDLVMEASGSLSTVREGLDVLAPGGIMCMLGIFEMTQADRGFGGRFRNIVRYNKVLFGSVSANKSHFQSGIEHLRQIEKARPGALRRMITAVVEMKDFYRLFLQSEEQEIKSVIEIT